MNKNDWVRQEIAHALKHNKNVIPVKSANFHFPENMPEDIEGIRYKNAVSKNMEFFDAMVEKLISFLQSKPKKKAPIRWILPLIAVCAAAALLFILHLWKKDNDLSSPEKQASPVVEENEKEDSEKTRTQSTTEVKTQAEPVEEAQDGYEKNVLTSDIFPTDQWYQSKDWTVFGSNIKRGEIGSVTILETLADAPADAWDVSQYANGSVKAWTVKNGDLYDLYIAGDGGIMAPEDCSVLFCGYENVGSIQFGDAFHTDQTTNMSYMFGCCSNLRGLDLSSFQTGNVTDMSAMFQYCSGLKALDISGFDTSLVDNMERLFLDCESLTQLDLSSFDGSKVTDMSEMFMDCHMLRETDLGSFTSDEVTDMSGMFFQCHDLERVTLGGFDAGNVPDEKKGDIFTKCEALTDVYYGGTQEMWDAAGLSETLPETAQVHFEINTSVASEAEKYASVSDTHQWGDYAPSGMAFIETVNGEKYTAIANSLVLKSDEVEDTWADVLYKGLDNPAGDENSDDSDMISFAEMDSVTRNGDKLDIVDIDGETRSLDLLEKGEVLFIGEEDSGEAMSVFEKDIQSITIDRNSTPDTEIKYCTVKMDSGTYRSPVAFLWFLVNNNEGGGMPSMELCQNLSTYAGIPLPVKRMKKITVTKNGNDSDMYVVTDDDPNPDQSEMTVSLTTGEKANITTGHYFWINTMAEYGAIREPSVSELREIDFE